jgi:hypothetical protein
MTNSTSFTPLVFLIVIGLLLLWQVLGSTGANYSLLYWIGQPWRSVSAKVEPVLMDPSLALMVWADEGGASQSAPEEPPARP